LITPYPLSIVLQSTVGTGLTIIVMVILVLFSFWSYRSTKPPVSRFLRSTLSILRALALISVWFLAINGTINWSFERTAQPRIALLIDQSSSMTIEDSQGVRSDVVKEIVNSDVIKEMSDKADITPFGFASSLSELTDSNDLSFGSSVTNYESILNQFVRLPDQNWAGIIVVSDGAYNSGGSPIEIIKQLEVPLIAIAVGDSLPPGDITITNIFTPAGGYVGEIIPFDVTVRATGIVGQQTSVRIVNESGDVVAEKSLTITKEWYEENIRFDITPEMSGSQNWRVEILPVENEIEFGNNSKQAVLNIADRRRKVLLFAASPNQDIASIARTLEDDKDSETDIIIGSGIKNNLIRGSWTYISNIDDYDAAIVFLNSKFNSISLQKLESIYSSNVPLIIITGNGLADPRVRGISETITGTSRLVGPLLETLPVPVKTHPIFYRNSYWFENSLVIPPLTLSQYVGASGETIATASDENASRDVLKVQNGNRRVIIWYAGDLWRWELARISEDPGMRDYQQLWNRQLRWLTSEQNEDRVVVSTDRMIYNSGEEVIISVNILDEAYQPVNDAVVNATITNGTSQRSINLNSISGGRYIVSYFPSTDGDYSVEATIAYSENIVRTTEFYVDKYNLELSDMRMRIDRLRSMTNSTNGKVLFPNEMDQLPALFSLKENAVEVNGLWRPFGKWLTLLILVSALALEWFIRTRKGMV
jgi:hypothetical protein